MQRLYTDWNYIDKPSTDSRIVFTYYESMCDIDGIKIAEVWQIEGALDYAYRIELTDAMRDAIETNTSYRPGPLVGHWDSPERCKEKVEEILLAAGFRLADPKTIVLR